MSAHRVGHVWLLWQHMSDGGASVLRGVYSREEAVEEAARELTVMYDESYDRHFIYDIDYYDLDPIHPVRLPHDPPERHVSSSKGSKSKASRRQRGKYDEET